VRERKLQRKEVETRYFNRNAKELPSLTNGDVVCKPQMERTDRSRPKLNNKYMSDPMLLELKMADFLKKLHTSSAVTRTIHV